MFHGYAPRKFYIAQFGYIWSYSPEAFERLLKEAARDGTCDLDIEGSKQLKGEFEFSKWADGRGKRPAQIPEEAIILQTLDQPHSWLQDAYQAFLDRDWNTLRYM